MPVHNWTRVYSGLFHDFHQSWSIRIKDVLNSGILPKGVNALIEQKSGPTEPDVLAVDRWDTPAIARGATALAPPATRIVSKSAKETYARRANRISVKHKLGKTLAVIEIVSPGNKDGTKAFKQFVDKSREFIDAGIHLLVVDLFPPTKRDPLGVHEAIWEYYEDEDVQFVFPEGKNRILASYDAGREKTAYVEPIGLGDSLPEMPLFLFDDYYVQVPLEAAYQTTWSVFPRDMQVYVETGIMPTPDVD